MWVGGNINVDLNTGWVSQLVSFGSGWILSHSCECINRLPGSLKCKELPD